MKLSLVNLAPLNEYGDYYDDIQDLKDELAQLYRDQEETAEPEGGPIQNAIGAEIEAKQKEIDQAINFTSGDTKQLKKDVPYDVAVGKMTQDEYDKHMLHVKYPKYYGPGGKKLFSTVKPDRDSFEKSSKFDRKEGIDKIGTARALPNDREYEDDEQDMADVKADIGSMMNEKELDLYQKSIAAKWDNESKKLGGGLFDTSRELEKTDTKQFNINVNNKLEFLTDLNNAGKFRKEYSDDQIENWTINPSLTGSTIAGKIKPKSKLGEAYSSMYEDMQDEGSCGYSSDGKPGDTPGETKGVDADDRTRTMLRKLMQKEIQKLSEKKGVPHYTKDGKEWKGATHKMPNGKLMTQDPHRKDSVELFHKEDLKETSLDDKLRGALGDKDFEKVINKPVPSFADMKPKSNTPSNPRTKDKHIRKPFDIK